jgi:hypothetical protein
MSKEVKEVWASSVDTEMISGLTKGEIKELIKELDDAVMRVCQDFGVC